MRGSREVLTADAGLVRGPDPQHEGLEMGEREREKRGEGDTKQ